MEKDNYYPQSKSRRTFLKSAAFFTGAAPLLAADECQTGTKRHPHKYEELLPEEFYAELKRMPVVYVPAGAMEEHGLQNVLAVDPWTAYETCLRAVNITGGILFPIVPFAPAGHPSWSREELRSGTRDAAPPSCFVSRELCRQIYIELMESLADLGFKACIAFGGHWPADFLLTEIQKEQNGVIRGMKFWGGGTVTILKDEMAKQSGPKSIYGGHGMMLETSLVMAIHRHWVDLSRVDDIKDSPLSHQLKKQPVERLSAIKEANADFGNRLLDIAASRLADLAKGLLA
ncbi:MAG: creatininase family protein [Kiritimatiellae bacterium]|nr:creatininase family protein [Kiritimatiellia bacterium]MDD5521767.1 creatininase family protein [Kiritimatiellia bacterium]